MVLDRRRARHLTANIPFQVSGMDITARATGDLAADGQELNFEVKIDTPLLCGRDPIISGTLLPVID